MYTVDIDVGGTQTDGLFSDGETVTAIKVDTTPHDLTVCFQDCLAAGADALGFDNRSDFLRNVRLIRWSTTITTNVLAERAGPKLGLFVTDGHERDLYAANGDSAAVGTLVDKTNVIGFQRPIDTATVLPAVKRLLENGVRRICVSLDGAFDDPSDEQLIKQTIDAQYPDHFLGSVPVLVASDISRYPDDMTRTHHALINSYVHGPLATSLYSAEDNLRDEGYERPLLIGHANGGVARVAKTKALDTLESGPTMGLFAAGHFADTYKLNHVVTLDVGGTTTKVGLIQDGRPQLTSRMDVFGIPVHAPTVLVRSIALGGGSVVTVDPETDQLTLGPESMGSYPGPACYDLGGTKATVTDALVVLGWLDPDYFMGGARQLNADRARKVLTEQVAEPLGVSLTEAAAQILTTSFRTVAQTIGTMLEEAGWETDDWTLFAFGGNGPIFAPGVAEECGTSNVYVFDLGPVFSAFGSSISDIVHVYEHGLSAPLESPQVTDAVTSMRDQALRDMNGEGITSDEIELELEFELQTNGRGTTRLALPAARFVDGDAGAIPDEYRGATVQLARLQATHPIPHFEPAPAQPEEGDASDAQKGTRDVTWLSGDGTTQVYDWDDIRPGQHVASGALLESRKNTYPVPPGWMLQKDAFGNGRLTKTAE